MGTLAASAAGIDLFGIQVAGPEIQGSPCVKGKIEGKTSLKEESKAFDECRSKCTIVWRRSASFETDSTERPSRRDRFDEKSKVSILLLTVDRGHFAKT